MAGCTQRPEPPKTYAVDPTFSDMQQAAIRDAVDVWCHEVEWCPTEVAFESNGRGNIYVGSSYWRFEENNDLMGWNDNDNIYMNPKNNWFGDPTVFWFAAAHELGHFGIGSGHTDKGVMAEVCLGHAGEQLALDVWSIMAWRAAQE